MVFFGKFYCLKFVENQNDMETGSIVIIRLFQYKSFRHYGGRSITSVPHTCKAKFIEQQRDHSFLCELQEPCNGFLAGHKIAVPSGNFNIKDNA